MDAGWDRWGALLISAGGAAIVTAVWLAYIASVPKGKVPARPVGSILLQLLGAALGAAGVVLAMRAGGSPGVAVFALASFAVGMAAFFLFLMSQRKTPVGEIKVAVGGELLPFEVQTDGGAPFSSDELAGRRVLLKFFRGSW